jgi:hypothetical protein
LWQWEPKDRQKMLAPVGGLRIFEVPPTITVHAARRLCRCRVAGHPLSGDPAFDFFSEELCLTPAGAQNHFRN